MEQATERAFLYGFHFDIVSWNRYVMEALQLRQMLSRWFNGSRFMDTIGISQSPPVLKAFAFRRTDGKGFLITVSNQEKLQDKRITFDTGVFSDRSKIARAFEPGAVPSHLALARKGTSVESVAPSASVSAVLLLTEQSEGEIMLTVCQVRMDNGLGLRVRLLNTRSSVAEVKLAVQARTTTFKDNLLQLTVPAQGSVTAMLPYISCTRREPIMVRAYIGGREAASARCGANPTSQGVFPRLK